MGKKGEGKEVAVKKGSVERATPSHALAPFDEMDRMFDRMFGELWPRHWMRPARWEWPSWASEMVPFEGRMPRVDVIDRDDEVLVKAELPGVDKDDVEVSMSGNTLTIKGSTKREQKEEKGDYYRCEISGGSFARTLTLPTDVDGEKAKAKFERGVLELTLPKIEGSKRRSIKID
ncbi:MAG: heat-shock protein Hsp20 [Gammaproteobacteria bacterium SG8_47]|nr:MAG: heat-shock protein Hsp20 [Gammaproteobacteria bacterium SG8_47]